MFLFVSIFIGFTTFVMFWRQIKYRRRNNLVNKIPGPPTYPIIGNLTEFMIPTDKLIPAALERAKKYGPIVRLWAIHMPIVILTSAEYIEVILSSNKEIKKSAGYKLTEPWLGQGLLTSSGKHWSKHRKLITPAFHFQILGSFIPIYEKNSEVLVNKISDKLKEAGNNDVINVYQFVTLCALDIICETAMGINIHAQDNTSSEYVKAVYKISKLLVHRITRPYLHPNIIYNLTSSAKEFKECVKVLHDFTMAVIQKRKAHRNICIENSELSDENDIGIKKRKAFLDLLLDANDALNDTDLREEVDTFMFGGHDTTTAGISWTLYLLGRNPEIQEKVAEEVNSLWPKGEILTTQALKNMKLLERVIKETLRLYPSVPFVNRELENDLKVGEYLIPAGTTLSVSKVVLHKDPTVFPDPLKFDPDRFLPENIQNRHPYAYVPFSAGPRNCIGQKFAILEEKSILASFVRSFKFEAVENEKDIVILSEIIQRPKNGINLRITLRDKI